MPCGSGLSPDPLKNIRRITVSLTTVPAGATTLTAGAAAGDATITVASTAGFPASGKLDVFTLSGTNVVGETLVSYSGKNDTQFTGCDGIPAVAAGSVVARAMPIGRAVKPFTMTASVMPQNLDAADEATPDCAPPAVPTGLAVIDTRSCINKLKVKWNADRRPRPRRLQDILRADGLRQGPRQDAGRQKQPGVHAQSRLPADHEKRRQEHERTSNTYAIQIVAYDASGNDSEKSAAVTGWHASADVSVFGGANDTTVNPLKPSPPTGLTVAHVPGWRFAVESPQPLAAWPPTKLFVLPGAAQGLSVLNRSDWPDDAWPVCDQLDDRENWPGCATWPSCADWPACPTWPDCSNRSCWPGYLETCVPPPQPPHLEADDGRRPSAVHADGAQGGLVVSWQKAGSATAGYRLYRSAAPFANGAHIDGSLQIAGSR